MADLILKLIGVLLLPYLSYDKMTSYAALLLGVALLTYSVYLLISRAVFQAVRFECSWNAEKLRSMLAFTAWNTWGNLASAMSEHGNNVLLNIFFGPAVNASRSIASQANGALNSFVINVQAAVNPQLIKLYASGGTAELHRLVLRAAKYNFYILLILALPVILNAEALLGIWLVKLPSYAPLFLQLTVASSLINSISGPLMTSAQATGHIRLYHTVVGGILLFNVPIGYVFLMYGAPPETVLMVTIGLSIIALIARLYIISPLIGLAIGVFFRDVVVKVILVALIVGSCSFFIFTIRNESIALFESLFISMIIPVIAVWFFGLEGSERKTILNLLRLLKERVN